MSLPEEPHGLTEGGGWDIPSKEELDRRLKGVHRRWPFLLLVPALLVGAFFGYNARSAPPQPPRATQTITVAPNPKLVISDTQTLVDAMVAKAPCWFSFKGDFGHVPLRPNEVAAISKDVQTLISEGGKEVVTGKRVVGDSTYVLILGVRCK